MQFRVGNFNLRNLALPNFQFYEQLKYSQSEYEEKCAWCTQQLQTMSADIVSFQEVFHFEALQKICEESMLYRELPICPINLVGEPRVGLVSKFPIKEWSLIEDLPPNIQNHAFQSFRRPLLKAIIELPNNTLLRVFAIHLKSKRALFLKDDNTHELQDISAGLARSLTLRSLEACAIRQFISEDPTIPTVVVGDFNDTAHSVTTQIIRGSHPPMGIPPEARQKIIDAQLKDVHHFIQKYKSKDIHFTYIYDGIYESVDHIFVSRHFYAPEQKGNIIYFQSYTDHLSDRVLFPQSKITSDHGQIVATLQLE